MILFWIPFLLAGLFGMVSGAVLISTGVRCFKWPRTNGRIVSSQITVREERSRDTTYYHPEVVYAYSVAGKQYHSNQVSAGDNDNSDRRRAKNIVDKCAPDMAVTVLYDPRDPANAVLEPGLGLSPILGLFGVIGGKGTPASS